MINSFCSELDQWYKYVKDNKGGGEGHMLVSLDHGKDF